MQRYLIQFYILFSGLLIFFLIPYTYQYKQLKVEYNSLCSEISKRKIKLDKDESTGLQVKQFRLNDHSLDWTNNKVCKFQVDSAFSKSGGGGVIAVIQYLNFRKDDATDECIDYIQFKHKDGSFTKKHCGIINATIVMNTKQTDPEKRIIYDTATIDREGELDVYINVSKKALRFREQVDLNIVFTSYKHCSKEHGNDFKPCSESFKTFCIRKEFFSDGIINCPYSGCTDENGCVHEIAKQRHSIGNKVLIGSISALFIMFGLFILMIWACKKHQLLCWSEDLSSVWQEGETGGQIPAVFLSPQQESNPNSTSGAGDAPSVSTVTRSDVRTMDEDKDLPPSYDSLFPNTR